MDLISTVNIVESVTARFVGIAPEDVRSRNAKSAYVKARRFAIYFLHTKYGFSGGQLCKLYGTSRNKIFDICAQIRGYAQVDAVYKRELREVEEMLNEARIE